MTTCSRCGRFLVRHVLINGIPFGQICAGKVTPPRHEPNDLLIGIDPAGAALIAMGRVQRAIDASAEYHLAAMRATWGRVAA